MKSKTYQILFTLLTIGLGTILHFTYEWSGNHPFVGIFSAINESTWEHLKLLVVPMVLFVLPEYFLYGYSHPNFIPVRFLSILLGMAVIVTAFYTYTGILGKDYLWADIIVFLLGVITAYWFSGKLLQTNALTSDLAVKLSLLGFTLLAICFIVFTYYPPEIGLFHSPEGT